MNSSIFQTGNGAEHSRAYVIKTYKKDRDREHYNYERETFDSLQGDLRERHIVPYYGAFQHGKTLNLILEYIPGCDLLSFMHSHQPPKCPEHVLNFWRNLIEVLTGVHHLHQVRTGDSASHRMQVVHQDIKPANILLEYPTGPDGQQQPVTPYSFNTYIADFGNSHVLSADPHNLALDLRGNQLYCAPEAVRGADSKWSGPSYITWKADIFSLGAVFSDVAAWVALGEPGRNEYLQKRIKETEALGNIPGSGYEGMFHDGCNPLQSVKDMHGCIRDSLPDHDNVTRRILQVVEDSMLKKKGRVEAKSVHWALKKEIDEAQREQSAVPTVSPPVSAVDKLSRVSSPVSPIPSCSVPGLISRSTNSVDSDFEIGTETQHTQLCRLPSPITRPTALPRVEGSDQDLDVDRLRTNTTCTMSTPLLSSASEQPAIVVDLSTDADNAKSNHGFDNLTPRSASTLDPRLSMADLQEYRLAKKAKKPIDKNVQKALTWLRSNLGCRDYIFLIDDSASMSNHSAQVEEALQNLGYIAKTFDPDCLELMFTSKAMGTHKYRRTSPLLEILKKCPYSSMQGYLETSLADLIRTRIIPGLRGNWSNPSSFFRLKPVTILIFTTGQWGVGVDRGSCLDGPIRNLMREMKEHGHNRSHVMIQFLRFGDDEEGWEHLQYLDRLGEDEKL